jgi:hypothetical protein
MHLDEKKLKTRAEALGWLRRQGYKCSRGKLYDDTAAGLLAVEPDGSIKIGELESYALRAGLKISGASVRDELATAQAAKAKVELKILKQRAKRQRFDMDRLRGKYIRRDEWEQALAARASVLLHGLRHLAQSRAAELLEIGRANGPQALGDRLQDDIETLLNEYANRETFKLLLQPDGTMEPIENEVAE